MVVFFCDFGCRQWHTIGIACTIGGCGVHEAHPPIPDVRCHHQ